MPAHYRTIDLLVNGARGSRRRGIATCKGCGRTIVWCATVAGKAMSFNEMPDVVELNGDVETVSTEHVHIATCPARDQFKRPTLASSNDSVQPPPAAEKKDPGFDW